jgi:CheY-like chemotaxis protein
VIHAGRAHGGLCNSLPRVDSPRSPLVLKFADRFSVWSDLVRSASNVFAPTADTWIVGEQAKVTVLVPDLDVPLVLTGEVWGCRAAGGRFPAGVFLSFDELEVSRCCLVLGLERTPQRLTGRRHPRVDCRLAARLVSPVEAVAEVTSLSQSGLSLSTGAPPETNTKVTLSVSLPEGPPVELTGTVVWARAQPGTLGMQFDALDSGNSILLASCVKALRAQESHLPQRVRTDVLVADDDPQILEFVSRVVRSMGCSVTSSARGDEALELARTLRPRLLLLDVLMPGIDGTELCQTLRGDNALSALPIILLSAMGNRLDQVADQAGATDAVAKPLTLAALRGLVEKYLPKAVHPPSLP